MHESWVRKVEVRYLYTHLWGSVTFSSRKCFAYCRHFNSQVVGQLFPIQFRPGLERPSCINKTVRPQEQNCAKSCRVKHESWFRFSWGIQRSFALLMCSCILFGCVCSECGHEAAYCSVSAQWVAGSTRLFRVLYGPSSSSCWHD